MRITRSLRRSFRKTRRTQIRATNYVKRATADLYARINAKGVGGGAAAMQRKGISWNRFFPRMRGGGSISVAGYTFLYSETDIDDIHEVLCISSSGRGLCFKIIFDAEMKTVSIDIGYDQGCSANKILPISEGTQIMMQAIMQIIFEFPTIRNYERLTLSDESVKYIPSFEDPPSSPLRYETRLMDMCFLSTGCTWYASLMPIFLTDVSDDSIYKSDIERIQSTTWTDFFSRLPDSVRAYMEEHVAGKLSIRPSDIASTILNQIRIAQTHSIVFHKFMNEFLDAMGVHSLRGKSWTLALRNGLIVMPENYACANTKRSLISRQLLEIVSDAEYASIKMGLQKKPRIINIDQAAEINPHGRYYNPTTSANDWNLDDDVGSVGSIGYEDYNALLMRRN
jgi:hypothetical protein